MKQNEEHIAVFRTKAEKNRANMKKNKKVIAIIGGGPAGLTAAYELLKDGGSEKYDVTVYEESDHLGGISATINHNGNRMDLGGHRFFSKDETIMNWWSNIMPVQGQPSFDDKVLGRDKEFTGNCDVDPEKMDNVMLIRDRVSRIYYDKKFFDYPVKMNVNTIKNMGIGKTFKSGTSYLMTKAHKLPEDNLENFYINRFGKQLYSMFFEGYTAKLWGRHPRDISADWGAQRVKGLSIPAILKDMFTKAVGKKDNANAETSLIEQFWYPKYGPGQLWTLVGDKILEIGGHIEYNSKVREIIRDDNVYKINSIVYEQYHILKEVKVDEVISSMPVKDLVNSFSGKEQTSETIKEIANGLPYRDFITVGILAKKLKLKNETGFKTLRNIVPDCWIYVQDKGYKMGRIQIFNNWSPYMVEKPADTVWIGLEYFCTEGDKLWNLSEKKFTECAIRELVKMGIVDREDIIDTHQEKVKKAYPAYFDTYSEFDLVKTYLSNISNLWCIGRNGQHRYNNMDHSMMTGIKTAEHIKNDNRDKQDIWNVNTEKEYHEEKTK